ncbi:hypothetical protein ACJWDR_19250 [Streptomyces tauricus]|uniref:hypothetical protein n=1 Tax=Streptomyces tauricus TaxID=68274 RepID=UPI00387F2C69
MPNLSHHARHLRDLADLLEAESGPLRGPYAPHPETQEILSGRHTRRGQLNYAVPNALQLQHRIRRYNADCGIPHGDIVALALDIYLRARGYPPDLTPSEAEKR